MGLGCASKARIIGGKEDKGPASSQGEWLVKKNRSKMIVRLPTVVVFIAWPWGVMEVAN